MSKDTPELAQRADALTRIRTITAGATITADHANVSEEVFFESAPEGITPELVKAVDDYRSQYCGDSFEALGELARENALGNNPVMTVAMGGGVTVEHSMIRDDEDGPWKSPLTTWDVELTGDTVMDEIHRSVLADLNR